MRGSDLSDDGDGAHRSRTSITSDGEVPLKRLALVSEGEIGEVKESTDVHDDGRESIELSRLV